MNKLVKTIDRKDLITEFLHSLNGIIKLTDRELELMAALVELDINYVELPNSSKNVANKNNRKWIINNLGITKDNLSRYLKSFREKGLLITGPAEDQLTVNRALIPEIIGDRVQLTIVLRLKEDENF